MRLCGPPPSDPRASTENKKKKKDVDAERPGVDPFEPLRSNGYVSLFVRWCQALEKLFYFAVRNDAR